MLMSIMEDIAFSNAGPNDSYILRAIGAKGESMAEILLWNQPELAELYDDRDFEEDGLKNGETITFTWSETDFELVCEILGVEIICEDFTYTVPELS